MERYRNHSDRVCHRTMLNAGYLDSLNSDQLNLLLKILTAKVNNPEKIVRNMNTHKAVPTLAQNVQDEVIIMHRCSELNQNIRKLYDAAKYKYAPFIKRKSIVRKSEFEKKQFIEKQYFSLI